jgi:hypothetical protein
MLERAALDRARSERQVIDAVIAARAAGASWQKIGSLLGTSAQAAEQRYASPPTVPRCQATVPRCQATVPRGWNPSVDRGDPGARREPRSRSLVSICWSSAGRPPAVAREWAMIDVQVCRA